MVRHDDLGADIDVLSALAKHHCASVCLSITTLDNELRKVMEPRTSPPPARFAAIRKLAEANIPVSVNIAPIIPGLTDHEIPGLLRAAHDAGATAAGFTVLRLPHATAPLFEQWLQTHFPVQKEKVLNRLKALRGGKLYDAEWGSRFRGEGIFAEQIARMFEVARRQAGFKPTRDQTELSTTAFRRSGGTQLSLFASFAPQAPQLPASPSILADQEMEEESPSSQNHLARLAEEVAKRLNQVNNQTSAPGGGIAPEPQAWQPKASAAPTHGPELKDRGIYHASEAMREMYEMGDAPSCSTCGAIMVRNGSCYRCMSCGSTSGCS